MLTAGDFEGFWALRRTIDDRHSKQVGDFRGSAVFRQGGVVALTYDESGKMKFGADGPILTAHRTYLWHFAQNCVAVSFEDDSPFHSFVPDGHVPGTTHLCGEDLYDVTYDFRDWPVWTATWSVKGPRKDYTSVSRYERG